MICPHWLALKKNEVRLLQLTVVPLNCDQICVLISPHLSSRFLFKKKSLSLLVKAISCSVQKHNDILCGLLYPVY